LKLKPRGVPAVVVEVAPGDLMMASQKRRTTMTTYTEYFEYLDALRESGVTNMFGASPYLEGSFGLTRKEANKVLKDWMTTFDSEKTAEERAELFKKEEE
jgi:hypothetical protein